MNHTDKEIEAEMLRIGKQIEDVMNARGINQFAVLRGTGITVPQLKDIQTASSNYTIMSLLKIRKFLGLQPDYEQAVRDTLHLVSDWPKGASIKEYGPDIFKRLTGKEI